MEGEDDHCCFGALDGFGEVFLALVVEVGAVGLEYVGEPEAEFEFGTELEEWEVVVAS